MFLLAIAMVCTIGFLQAQESPKPPAPPPAESIIPPAPPKPPVVENEDTTRISLGDKQILIINKNQKKIRMNKQKQNANWKTNWMM